MGFYQSKHLFTITLICMALSFCQQILAMRPLEGEQWLQKNLVIQSLQRGPVPPVGRGNPCTFIPNRGRGRCTSEVDFAVSADDHHLAHRPPAFPDIVVKFAAALPVNNKTHKQDSSS